MMMTTTTIKWTWDELDAVGALGECRLECEGLGLEASDGWLVRVCLPDDPQPVRWSTPTAGDEGLALAKTRAEAIAGALAGIDRAAAIGATDATDGERRAITAERDARSTPTEPDQLFDARACAATAESMLAAAREAGREEGRREVVERVRAALESTKGVHFAWQARQVAAAVDHVLATTDALTAEELEQWAKEADPDGTAAHSPKSTEPAAKRNGGHVVIASDYPGEPSIHIMRHEDGDYGIAVVDGDRWPGKAATMCSSGGRNPDAWQAVAALWRSTEPTKCGGTGKAPTGPAPEPTAAPTDKGRAALDVSRDSAEAAYSDARVRACRHGCGVAEEALDAIADLNKLHDWTRPTEVVDAVKCALYQLARVTAERDDALASRGPLVTDACEVCGKPGHRCTLQIKGGSR